MNLLEFMEHMLKLHKEHGFDTLNKDVVIRDLNGLDWVLEPQLIKVEGDRLVIDSTNINRVP